MWAKLSKALENKDQPPKRRRAESSASTSSSRKQREGYLPSSTAFASSSRSASAGFAPASIASSHATASNNAPHHEEPRLIRTESVRDRREHDRRKERSRSCDRKGREGDRPRSRSLGDEGNRRRRRSTSRERRKAEEREERDRRKSRDQGVSRSGTGETRRSSRGDVFISNGDHNPSAGSHSRGPSSQTFATDAINGSGSKSYPTNSPLVTAQFPGQFPVQSTAPYRPPLSVKEGGPGLAADYYGTYEQPLVEQPALRPRPASVITATQPHQQSPPSISNPPPALAAMGGVGPATSFHSGTNSSGHGPAPALSTVGQLPDKPGKASHHEGTVWSGSATGGSQVQATPTSLPHSSSAPVISTLGAAASGAAVGYMMGSGGHHIHDTRPQTHINGTAGPSTPGKHYSGFKPRPHTASTAAGIAASVSTPQYHSGHAHYASGHHVRPGSHSYQSGQMALKHRHRGPVQKFIDFWKDPEAVGEFEEYTEYIGVCKGCFEPGSSPRDAPRKHHYRKRRSGGRHDSSSRINKDRRYSSSTSSLTSSDNGSHRRKSKASWITTGLAGYGIAKVGKSLFKADDDSSDGHGRRSSHAGKPARTTSTKRMSDHDSRIARSTTEPNISIGGSISRHEQRSANSTSSDLGRDEPGLGRRSTVQWTSSQKQRPGEVATGGIAPVVASAVAASHSRRRNGSNFPKTRHATSQRRSHDGSPAGQFSVDIDTTASRVGSSRHAHRPSVEEHHSPRQSKYSLTDPAGGVSTHERRRKKSTRSSGKSFFGFGKSSPSSSESSLVYSSHLEGNESKKSGKSKRRSRRDDATLLGLGAAAALLASQQPTKQGSGRRSRPYTGHDANYIYKQQSLPSASGPDEEGWESAAEGDSSSSDKSALAFGTFYDKGKVTRRKSDDSLSSAASSGTDKWSWRWSNKPDKKKGKSHQAPVAASALDGVAATAGIPHGFNSQLPSNGSKDVAPLSYVYPVSTSDPTRFDVSRHNLGSPSNVQPLYNSQPTSLPLQQPQPIAAVTAAVYSNQSARHPGYVVPTGPPVFARGPLQQNVLPYKPEHEIATEYPKDARYDPRPLHSIMDERNLEKGYQPDKQIVPPGPGISSAGERAKTTHNAPTMPQQADLSHSSKDKKREEAEAEAARRPERSKRRDENRKERAKKQESEKKPEGNQKETESPTETKQTRSGKPTPSQVPRFKDDDSNQNHPVVVADLVGVAAAALNNSVGASKSPSRSRESGNEVPNSARRSSSDDYGTTRPSPLRNEFDDCQKEKVRDDKAKESDEDYSNVPSVLDKYKEEQLPMAAYFVPPELLYKSKSKEAPQIIEVAPDSGSVAVDGPLNDPFATGEGFSRHLKNFPWIVPSLNLITPTPPRSVRSSVSEEKSAPSSPSRPEAHAAGRPADMPSAREVSHGNEPTRGEDEVVDTNYAPSRDKSRLPDTPTKNQDVEDDVIRSTASQLPHIPGGFDDDIEFAATLAAGLEDTGFDPAIVIDDPSFRRRDSPPGSEDPGTYPSFSVEPVFEVIEVAPRSPKREVTPPEPGYIEGEIIDAAETDTKPIHFTKELDLEQGKRGQPEQPINVQVATPPVAEKPESLPGETTEYGNFSSNKKGKGKKKKGKRVNSSYDDAQEWPATGDSLRETRPEDGDLELKNSREFSEQQVQGDTWMSEQKLPNDVQGVAIVPLQEENLADEPEHAKTKDVPVESPSGPNGRKGKGGKNKKKKQREADFPWDENGDSIDKVANPEPLPRQKLTKDQAEHSPLIRNLPLEAEIDSGYVAENLQLAKDASEADTYIPDKIVKEEMPRSEEAFKQMPSKKSKRKAKRSGVDSTETEEIIPPEPVEDVTEFQSKKGKGKARKDTASALYMAPLEESQGTKSSRFASVEAFPEHRNGKEDTQEPRDRNPTTAAPEASEKVSSPVSKLASLVGSILHVGTAATGHTRDEGEKGHKSGVEIGRELKRVIAEPGTVTQNQASKALEKRRSREEGTDGASSDSMTYQQGDARAMPLESLKVAQPLSLPESQPMPFTTILSSGPPHANVLETSQSHPPPHYLSNDDLYPDDFPPLPQSRPTSPIEVGSLKELPTLPSTRPTSPIEVGSLRELPILPGSRPTSPIEVGSLKELPTLPSTRPTSPIAVGSLRELPTLPPTRPTSPIEVGSLKELPTLPHTRPTSPIEVGSLKELPSLPTTRPTSPIEVGSLKELPALPSTRPTSPIEIGSVRELPILPESRPTSPIEVGSLNELPPLPLSRPTSPVAVGSLKELPTLPPTRPTSPIEVGSIRELPMLPPTRSSSPIEVGSLKELPALPLTRPTSPIGVGSPGDLPTLPSSRTTSPIEVGSFRELPSLPSTRPTSPIEVGSLRELPALPSSRPTSPIEVGSIEDLPPLPASRSDSPLNHYVSSEPPLSHWSQPDSPFDFDMVRNLSHISDSRSTSPVRNEKLDTASLTSSSMLTSTGINAISNRPHIPDSGPTSPVQIDSPRNLPAQTLSQSISSVDAGSSRDVPLLPDAAPNRSIESDVPKGILPLHESAESSPNEPPTGMDVPRLSGPRPSSSIQEGNDRAPSEFNPLFDFVSPAERHPLPSSQPTSPSEVGTLRGAPPFPASFPSQPANFTEDTTVPPFAASHPAPINITASNGHPASPLQTPKHLQSDLTPAKGTSPTAIPLTFRRPPSGGLRASSYTATGTSTDIVSSPIPKSRHYKTASTEFKPSTEYRPLYLVERHSARQLIQPDEEKYPPLPASEATTRSPSLHSTGEAELLQFAEEDNIELPPLETPRLKGPGLTLDTEWNKGENDILGSQQATPTVATFSRDKERYPDSPSPSRGAVEAGFEVDKEPTIPNELEQLPESHFPNNMHDRSEPGKLAPASQKMAACESVPSVVSGRSPSPVPREQPFTLVRPMESSKVSLDFSIDNLPPLPASRPTSPDEKISYNAPIEHHLTDVVTTPAAIATGQRSDINQSGLDSQPASESARDHRIVFIEAGKEDEHDESNFEAPKALEFTPQSSKKSTKGKRNKKEKKLNKEIVNEDIQPAKSVAPADEAADGELCLGAVVDLVEPDKPEAPESSTWLAADIKKDKKGKKKGKRGKQEVEPDNFEPPRTFGLPTPNDEVDAGPFNDLDPPASIPTGIEPSESDSWMNKKQKKAKQKSKKRNQEASDRDSLPAPDLAVEHKIEFDQPAKKTETEAEANLFQTPLETPSLLDAPESDSWISTKPKKDKKGKRAGKKGKQESVVEEADLAAKSERPPEKDAEKEFNFKAKAATEEVAFAGTGSPMGDQVPVSSPIVESKAEKRANKKGKKRQQEQQEPAFPDVEPVVEPEKSVEEVAADTEVFATPLETPPNLVVPENGSWLPKETNKEKKETVLFIAESTVSAKTLVKATQEPEETETPEVETPRALASTLQDVDYADGYFPEAKAANASISPSLPVAQVEAESENFSTPLETPSSIAVPDQAWFIPETRKGKKGKKGAKSKQGPAHHEVPSAKTTEPTSSKPELGPEPDPTRQDGLSRTNSSTNVDYRTEKRKGKKGKQTLLAQSIEPSTPFEAAPDAPSAILQAEKSTEQTSLSEIKESELLNQNPPERSSIALVDRNNKKKKKGKKANQWVIDEEDKLPTTIEASESSKSIVEASTAETGVVELPVIRGRTSSLAEISEDQLRYGSAHSKLRDLEGSRTFSQQGERDPKRVPLPSEDDVDRLGTDSSMLQQDPPTQVHPTSQDISMEREVTPDVPSPESVPLPPYSDDELNQLETSVINNQAFESPRESVPLPDESQDKPTLLEAVLPGDPLPESIPLPAGADPEPGLSQGHAQDSDFPGLLPETVPLPDDSSDEPEQDYALEPALELLAASIPLPADSAEAIEQAHDSQADEHHISSEFLPTHVPLPAESETEFQQLQEVFADKSPVWRLSPSSIPLLDDSGKDLEALQTEPIVAENVASIPLPLITDAEAELLQGNIDDKDAAMYPLPESLPLPAESDNEVELLQDMANKSISSNQSPTIVPLPTDSIDGLDSVYEDGPNKEHLGLSPRPVPLPDESGQVKTMPLDPIVTTATHTSPILAELIPLPTAADEAEQLREVPSMSEAPLSNKTGTEEGVAHGQDADYDAQENEPESLPEFTTKKKKGKKAKKTNKLKQVFGAVLPSIVQEKSATPTEEVPAKVPEDQNGDVSSSTSLHERGDQDTAQSKEDLNPDALPPREDVAQGELNRERASGENQGQGQQQTGSSKPNLIESVLEVFSTSESTDEGVQASNQLKVEEALPGSFPLPSIVEEDVKDSTVSKIEEALPGAFPDVEPLEDEKELLPAPENEEPLPGAFPSTPNAEIDLQLLAGPKGEEPLPGTFNTLSIGSDDLGIPAASKDGESLPGTFPATNAREDDTEVSANPRDGKALPGAFPISDPVQDDKRVSGIEQDEGIASTTEPLVEQGTPDDMKIQDTSLVEPASIQSQVAAAEPDDIFPIVGKKKGKKDKNRKKGQGGIAPESMSGEPLTAAQDIKQNEATREETPVEQILPASEVKDVRFPGEDPLPEFTAELQNDGKTGQSDCYTLPASKKGKKDKKDKKRQQGISEIQNASDVNNPEGSTSQSITPRLAQEAPVSITNDDPRPIEVIIEEAPELVEHAGSKAPVGDHSSEFALELPRDSKLGDTDAAKLSASKKKGKKDKKTKKGPRAELPAATDMRNDMQDVPNSDKHDEATAKDGPLSEQVGAIEQPKVEDSSQDQTRSAPLEEEDQSSGFWGFSSKKKGKKGKKGKKEKGEEAELLHIPNEEAINTAEPPNPEPREARPTAENYETATASMGPNTSQVNEVEPEQPYLAGPTLPEVVLPGVRTDQPSMTVPDTVINKTGKKGKKNKRAQQFVVEESPEILEVAAPRNRDSAVHVSDSPFMSDWSPERTSVRDSGFQESVSSPLPPAVRQSPPPATVLERPPETDYGLGDAISPDLAPRKMSMDEPTVLDPLESPDSPEMREHDQGISPQDPLSISLEIEPQYRVSTAPPEANNEANASQPFEQPALARLSPKVESASQLDINLPPSQSKQAPEIQPSTPVLPEPQPVSSTTKERDSGLFKSPPWVEQDTINSPAQILPSEVEPAHAPPHLQEQPWAHPTSHMHLFSEQDRAIASNGSPTAADTTPALSDFRHDDISLSDNPSREPQDNAKSLFGGPIGVNSDADASLEARLSPLSSQSRPLDTIIEASSNEGSPLAERSQNTASRISPSSQGPDEHKTAHAVGLSQESQELHSPSHKHPTRTEAVTGAETTAADTKFISTDELISRLSWPSVDDASETVNIERVKSRDSNQRLSSPLSHASNPPVDQFSAKSNDRLSPSGRSNDSKSSRYRLSTPERQMLRAPSELSQRSSGTPPLRRVDRVVSGDLRAASKRDEATLAKDRSLSLDTAPPSTPDPRNNTAKGRVSDMAAVYEGWGDVHGSPLSPTRPPSVRRRQSLQIIDLETRVEQLASDNRQLQISKTQAEKSLEDKLYNQKRESSALSEAIESQTLQLREKDTEIGRLKETVQWLQTEVSRLTVLHGSLTATNANLTSTHNERYNALQVEHDQTKRELEDTRQRYDELSGTMESVVRKEVSDALEEKDAEIDRLRAELDAAKEEVRALQREILQSKPKDNFLVVRDEDYFEVVCQQLCQHVQQWVLRFSKFSDMRGCRLVEEVEDDKIVDRLENAILDGSDVDIYLNDRVKRRDVFMSVVMAMVWEYIFTRYLFGMDREQRQKLKSLEKLLGEVGPPAAVHHWRATTLTLLSHRPAFQTQRKQDSEAVVQEVYKTLWALLPPPSNLEQQIQESLRNVIRSAVDISIEMRTQRAEYMMLPPLQPEYDSNGELARKVYFNASLMNDRTGGSQALSNGELEAQHATVKMVLFPLVLKRGDDDGLGEDEIVVCPAQVLVSDPQPTPKDKKKVVRVVSGDPMALDTERPRSRARSQQSQPQYEDSRAAQNMTPSTLDMGNMI